MFWHMAGTVKTLIFLRFFKVFRYSGVLEGLVETSWRPCWTILGPRCGQEGYKMNDFGQVGDLGGHLGAKMGPTNFQKNFRRRGRWIELERSKLLGVGRRQRRVQWEGKGGNKSPPGRTLECDNVILHGYGSTLKVLRRI